MLRIVLQFLNNLFRKAQYYLEYKMTHFRFNFTLLLVVLLSASIWGCRTQNIEPTVVISPLSTSTPSLSPTITQTTTATPSKTPTPTSSFTTEPTNTITPSITPSPTPILALLKVHRIAIMSGPGFAYDVLAEYYPGLDLEIIGQNETGNWLVISLPGGHGWAQTKDLEFNFDTSILPFFDTPPTPVPSNTPQPAPKISRRYVYTENNKMVAVSFTVSNLQPNEPFTFEIMSLDGKFYKAIPRTADSKGENSDLFMNFHGKSMPSGDYQTILRGDFGSFAMGSFSVP